MKLGLRILSILVFTLVAGVSTFFINPEAKAQTENCNLEIIKSSDPANNTTFVFENVSGEIVFEVPLRDPESRLYQTGLGPGLTLSVTELPTPGWELESIVCETEGAIDYSIEGATVTIDCIGSEGAISCVFNNVLGAKPIPALSEWGLIAMAGLIGIAGLIYYRRRIAHA